MGSIDLKNVTFKLVDGRLAALTTTAAAGINGRITLTDKSRHRGTQDPVTITLVDPGVTHTLSVVVTGVNIVVTLGYATGAITTTATALKAILDATAAALALVTTTLPGTGASLVSAQAVTSLALGARSLTMKIGTGTLNWTEHKNREYLKNRGLLDTVRDGDEEPLDLTFNFQYSWMRSDDANAGEPSARDVLHQINDASGWTSTGDPTLCEPYCVDVEMTNVPGCAADDEIITFQEFRFETLAPDPKGATVAVSGKCNRTKATVVRQAA